MKHIDKVFKDQLQNHEMNVPEGMWEKIAPAIEKDSGRGVLWFWLAGILAVALAGALYFAMNSSSSTSQMVDNQQPDENQTNVVENTLAIQQETSNPIEENDIENVMTVNTVETTVASTNHQKRSSVTHSNPKTIEETKKPVAKTVQKTSVATLVNSTVENTDSDVSFQGKPANIVITKSFISDNGAMIEKSNLNTNGTTTTSPKYNVFINSEGLGAGALMRIVDPVESIQLPYLKNTLKKKVVKHQL